MRWVAFGKKFSNGRLLHMITPVPGRSRTRATASLRRPVVWMRGFGTPWTPCGSWRSGRPGLAGVGGLQRLRLLGGVGMRRARVDLELLQHLPAEGTLGE